MSVFETLNLHDYQAIHIYLLDPKYIMLKWTIKQVYETFPKSLSEL